jgi:hypothetical protein
MVLICFPILRSSSKILNLLSRKYFLLLESNAEPMNNMVTYNFKTSQEAPCQLLKRLNFTQCTVCHDFDSSPNTQKKMIKFKNWQVSVSCLPKFQDPKGNKTGSQGWPYLRVLIITKGIKSNPVTCHDFDSSPYTQKKMIKFKNWQVSVSCLHKFQDPKGNRIGSQGRPYLQVLIIPEGIKSNPVMCHGFDSSPYTQKKTIKFENWQVSVSCLHKF